MVGLALVHGAGAVDEAPLPFADRYECSSALPPAIAAGFVQPAIWVASRTRPNSEVAGGGEVERNDANVMTQPSCSGVRHSGTFWNVPPTSAPCGTATEVPISIAVISRGSSGALSS